jgi:putative ABC transport system permease protein
MWKATIRGLMARKVRLALTALAILLGVSFVSATYVLTDTVKQSFDAVFAQTLSGVDLKVQGASALGDVSNPGRIPDTTVNDVRRVPGVRRAEGFVQTTLAQFVDSSGKSIGGGGPPTLGISWADHGPLHLTAAHRPAWQRQLAMGAATAAKHGFAVGDDVRVPPSGAAKRFRSSACSGSATPPTLRVLRRLRPAIAQRVRRRVGHRRGLRAARPGRAHRGAAQRIETALGPAYDVLTAQQATLEVGKPVRQFLGFFTDALLGFAAIGVVVGAFIIFNTFTILVTQRTRELGLLRAMGATGGQVVRSVVLEAFLVAAVASLLGLLAGIGLGVGLLQLLRDLGLDLPDTTTVLLARRRRVAAAVGIGVTVVAALLPAVRRPGATRGGDRRRGAPASGWVPPPGDRRALGARGRDRGADLRAGPPPRRDRSRRPKVQVVAIGAFGVLAGVVMVLPAVARPAVRAIGAPLRRLGPPGSLARANAMRNPRRTAITASALVIGLALVGLTATFGASARASVGRDTGAGLRADYVVKADGFAGFSGRRPPAPAGAGGGAAVLAVHRWIGER